MRSLDPKSFAKKLKVKKRSEATMLLYQFTYYWMVEMNAGAHWKRWRDTRSFANFKAVLGIIFLEMFPLLSLWSTYVIVSTKLGFPVHKSHFGELHKSSIISLIAFPIATLFYFINLWILGTEKRIAHYRGIFDGWDNKMRTRWKIYVGLLCLGALGSCLFLAEIALPMLVP